MKKKSLIIDIDGTLTNIMWRLDALNAEKRDWDAIDAQSKLDLPNTWCVNLVELYMKAGYHIVFLTGRNEKYRASTDEWLESYLSPDVIRNSTLIMRPLKDYRDDCLVKKDLYYKYIEPYFDVEFCIDDRPSVASMLRSFGLTVLVCQEKTQP